MMSEIQLWKKALLFSVIKITETYYPNGQICEINFKNEYGYRHNIYGPARLKWYENGNKKLEEYYFDGKSHRLGNKPAATYWTIFGYKSDEIYYYLSKLHNENGPAWITFEFDRYILTKKSEGYYLNGRHNA